MPRYAKPPIREAMIVIQLELPERVGVEELGHLEGVLPAGYRLFQQRHEAQGHFHFEPGGAVSVAAQQKVAGFLYRSADEKYVLQALRDFFLFSRLAPYSHWEAFRDEARRVWEAYRRQMQPRELRKLGLRYINQIDIPEVPGEVEQYFRVYPATPPELAEPLTGLFMQFRCPQPSVRGELVLNQVLIPPAREGVVSIVLDIEVDCIAEVPQSDAGLWQMLEQLRMRKNGIFEASITDRARELFQ